MDRFNDQKINQYLTEFGKEAQELDKEMREATTIEKEKPIKARQALVQAIVYKLYSFDDSFPKAPLLYCNVSYCNIFRQQKPPRFPIYGV